MKNLKKLSIIAFASLMVLGTISIPTSTNVSAEARYIISNNPAPMACRTCGTSLKGTFGACTINTGSGYCFQGQNAWACQRCSTLWYRCKAGHANF